MIAVLVLLAVSAEAQVPAARDPWKCGRAVAARALRGPNPSWIATPFGCRAVNLPAPFEARSSLLGGPEIRVRAAGETHVLGVLYDRRPKTASPAKRRLMKRTREFWAREHGRTVHVTEIEEEDTP